MVLITKRQLLGNIQGHDIYGIGESQLITVPHSSLLTKLTHSNEENRLSTLPQSYAYVVDLLNRVIESHVYLFNIFYRYKRLFSSVNLSKDFFYSYTYRIMWNLQRNMSIKEVEPMPYDDMFVWNSFMSQEFRNEVKSTLWTVALVYGFFNQVTLHIFSAHFSSIVSCYMLHVCAG